MIRFAVLRAPSSSRFPGDVPIRRAEGGLAMGYRNKEGSRATHASRGDVRVVPTHRRTDRCLEELHRVTRIRPRGGLSGDRAAPACRADAKTKPPSWESVEATRNPVSNQPSNVEVA
jgi:hypothetical protein